MSEPCQHGQIVWVEARPYCITCSASAEKVLRDFQERIAALEGALVVTEADLEQIASYHSKHEGCGICRRALEALWKRRLALGEKR